VVEIEEFFENERFQPFLGFKVDPLSHPPPLNSSSRSLLPPRSPPAHPHPHPHSLPGCSSTADGSRALHRSLGK
jgi:hypothetical protein